MTELLPHPYAAFLQRVEKPTRYTGAEHGSRKKDWSGVEARVCLAFPDVYDIGMSHLGFRILYKILNDDPRTLAERCYTPWLDLQDELRKRGLPLVSLESARPLSEFDVVGFSLQFELTYTNILAMLELGGIPLRSEARGEDDPLVVAGGPVATHPEPMAPFLRRSADRRRRGGRHGHRPRLGPRHEGRALATRALALTRPDPRRLRAVALRDARSTRTPGSRS